MVHDAPSADGLPDTGAPGSDLYALLKQMVDRFAAVDVDVLWGLLAESARVTERRTSLPLDLMRNELLLRGSMTEDAIAEIIDEIFLPLVYPTTT